MWFKEASKRLCVKKDVEDPLRKLGSTLQRFGGVGRTAVGRG
jgi:hypothetical protein